MIDVKNSFSMSLPLLVTSNQEIDYLQKKIITNTEQLTKEISNAHRPQPQKILIYEIETPLYKRGLLSYLRANQKKLPNLFKIFTDLNKAATLSYFSDNLILHNIADSERKQKEITHSLSELPFNKSHNQNLVSSSSSIEKILATFSDLVEIDKLLSTDLSFLQSKHADYFIFINFKYEEFSSNFALKEVIEEEKQAKYKFVDAAQQYEYSRQLEDDEHEEEHRQIESLVETVSDSESKEAIGIPGYVFSGYLLGLLGLATTLIAVVALYEIKTPTKFARQNLNFGKEY